MSDETGVVTRFVVIGASVAKNVMGRKFADQMEEILHVSLSRLPNGFTTGSFFLSLASLLLTFLGQSAIARHLGDDFLGLPNDLVLDLTHDPPPGGFQPILAPQFSWHRLGRT
jgi:hypothetical protein